MTDLNVQSVPGDSIAGPVQVTISRTEFFDTCTIGTLHIRTKNLVWRCKTLELPYLDNWPQVSCIPTGTYTCKRVKSAKFGETFQICDVPNRDKILFHAGNTPRDTHGCILLGIQSEKGGGSVYLISSRPAMQTFMKMLDGIKTFDLVIS